MVAAILYTTNTGLNFDISEQHIQMVRDALPDAEVVLVETPEELTAKGIDPEVLITWVTGGGHFSAVDFCVQSQNLKWIHGLSAGVEGITQTNVAKRPGLILTNAKGIHGTPISEHVLGFMIYHYRGFGRMLSNQAARHWSRFIPEELCGKTLGILGMGSIAAEVARRAKAFGMTVLGVKRTVMPVEFVDEVYPDTRMDEVIARADTLVMLLPATPRTNKIMNAERFAKMKPGSFFINVGRGSTVDTDALVDALVSGQLSGAALDANDPEPLPEDHPLWTMPNVMISPHMSAETPRYMERAFRVFQDNAPYFLKGEPLPNQIEIENY